MENQVVRRRMNVVAAHLAAYEDVSATTPAHIFPMSCSNSLNSIIRRCDNRVLFARQGSSSQSCFMRPASRKQTNYTQSTTPLKPSGCENKGFDASDAPRFSRPSQMEPGIPNIKEIHSAAQGCEYSDPAVEAPKFARTKIISEEQQLHSNEFGWTPRMDVAESERNYVVYIELPGVSHEGIRVEVSGHKLLVSGNRSTCIAAGDSCPSKLPASYHKREIVQGPYQIVWPLPTNVNRDTISAEFLDGLLQVMIPKLSGYMRLRKAHI